MASCFFVSLFDELNSDRGHTAGYRKLRIRTVRRGSGLPTVIVYLGGWRGPPIGPGDEGALPDPGAPLVARDRSAVDS